MARPAPRPGADAGWKVGDLAARLCRALDLAAVVVEDFGRDGYRDVEMPSLSFGPEKVVAEAAMLAHVASRASTDRPVRDRVDALAERLVPLARSPRVLADAALEPGRAFTYAVPHVLLAGLGRPDERFDRFLRGRCERALATWRDLPPSAELERAWIARLWGWAAAGAEVLDGPHFGRPLAVCSGAREDAYAFTHQLFYLTDFGGEPRVWLARPRADLLAEVEVLLLRFLDAEDYDAAGELLMTWPELGAAWTPTATFAFRVLARVEDEVGVLPCGNVDPERLDRLAGPERTRYARATGYHTGFVMGFLCAAVLASDAPPPTVVADDDASDAWADLWPLADPGQGHWLVDFARATVEEKRALTPTLATLLVLQRVRLRDYAGLAELLRGRGCSALPRPVVAAALDRLGSVSDAADLASALRSPAPFPG